MQVFWGQLRHALSALGGYMAAQGYIAEDQINLMVGGAMVIAAGLFSWIQKRMNNASVSKSSSGRKGRPRV